VSLPLVTGAQYAEQLQRTADVVAAVWETSSRWATSRGEAVNASPVWREWKGWVRAWGHFQESQAIAPLLPLPPPLPSIFVRPAAWTQLRRWDQQARRWAERWRAQGAGATELPPPIEPPPELDPAALGLEQQAKPFGLGVLVGIVAGVLIDRRL
jgi:hypothetical protein